MSEPLPISPRRMSVAARIFLLITGLLVLSIGSAVLISIRQGGEIADRAVTHALEASGALQDEFSAQRLEEMNLKAQLIAADPAFVNYISDAQTGAGADAETNQDGSASIFDLLKERQDSYGFDLGLILDYQGGVLARTDQPEAFEQSLAEDPFVADAVADLQPISGYWRMGDQVYQAAILPLDQAGDLVGFLMIAKAVDPAFSKQIRAVSDADIAFLIPVGDRVQVIGTSLDDSTGMSEFLSQIAANTGGIAETVKQGGSLNQIELTLGGSRWIGRLSPLAPEGGPSVGSALQLTSSDKAEAGYRDILNAVALAGLVALLCALPLSFLLAKVTLRPLRTMANIAKDAVAGKYQTRIALGGNDELAELSLAFESLLSDLRGERDIESYLTHLTRLLPEPGDETAAISIAAPITPAQPPRRAVLTLIGIDAPRHSLSDVALEADGVLEQLRQYTAGIMSKAAGSGGELLTSTGSRLIVGFAGESQRDNGLRFALDVLLAEPDTTLAAFAGEVVLGSIQSTALSFSTAVGLPIQQLERLLADASPASVILSKTMGDELKASLGDDAVQVIKGTISGKAFYSINADALARLPAAEPAHPSALMDMATVVLPGLGQRTAVRPLVISATADLPIGTQLGGRFRILSVLGSGGMGVVYKARDLELDDVVAIKMLRGEALADREQLERLKSEIKLARRITHPNVLRTFDFGDVDGHPFISMEYVRGMTLRYLMKQSERVPFNAALRIVRQLCAGLQAAHEVGVLHRDIKPENLILEASGNAKLMDFGIARPVRRTAPGSTEPGMYIGTPAYSAPEQLAGQDVDNRADIFACGVLMNELFCGQLPFIGASTVEIYMAQMQSEPRRPREIRPDMPVELEAIILRCIQRRAEDRFRSAAELADALAGVRA